MKNETKIIATDGKSNMSEQEMNEWKAWAEKWIIEDNTDTVVTSKEMKIRR